MPPEESRPDWLRWRVSGRVQGVGFRWFVQQAATRIGIVGDVCNLPDGRVEVRARGTREQLRRLHDEVRRGPSHSVVEDVEELPSEPVPGISDFRIRR